MRKHIKPNLQKFEVIIDNYSSDNTLEEIKKKIVMTKDLNISKLKIGE